MCTTKGAQTRVRNAQTRNTVVKKRRRWKLVKRRCVWAWRKSCCEGVLIACAERLCARRKVVRRSCAHTIPLSSIFCCLLTKMAFLRFVLVLDGLESSGRPVGTEIHHPGTYKSPWCRVMTKNPKQITTINV